MLTTSPQDTPPHPALSPGEIEAALQEALAALEAEWHDETVLACERILKADPNRAEAVFLLGLMHFDLDEPLKAIEILERAHALNPRLRECADALAAVQVRIGKVSDALFYAKLATTLAPHPTIKNLLPERFGTFFKNFQTGNPNVYRYRAERQFEAGAFAEAAAHCRRQLELTPGEPETLRILGRASLKTGRFETAAAAFHAIPNESAPEASDLIGLSAALEATGHGEEAAACRAAALTRAPTDAGVHSAALAALARRPGTTAEALEAAHAKWRTRHLAGIAPRAVDAAGPRDPDRPLRVAYLSGAFRQDDFVELFEPILRLHHPNRLAAYCYSDAPFADSVTESLIGAAAKWTDIAGIDDETVWQILRGDEIDIAVDLSGHFEGGRPLVFARRPAPVTLSWLGYPCPLGLPGMDYFLTDAATCPDDGAPGGVYPGGSAAWRLPRPALSFLAPTTIPAVGAGPAARGGAVTFGVKCDLSLLTPALVQAWAQVLWAQDRATLLICNRFDQDEASIRRVGDLFAHFGLRGRMDIVNMSANFTSEYAFYEHIDIALDPGSCETRVEACRALWMGVPVLSLAGGHAAARQGAGLLAAAGCADWSAGTAPELAALAADLGRDPGRLAELRAGLRERVGASALGDPLGLYAALDEAYRRMWRQAAGAP